MIAVIFFRWIYGYFDFIVEGTFPERFLNLASRKGIRLWNTFGSKESFSASAAISDMELISRLVKKTGCIFSIKKRHGLPAFCSKYKYRCGLLIGAVIGSVLCVHMSGFIWNIKVNVPDELNEYEIRRELAQTGLYEGIPYNYDNISTIERRVKLLDDRISWISINVFGTNAEVEVSYKKTANNNKESNTVMSNMISKADGIVTRIEANNAKPAVHTGDGIRKGQLLLSGIVPYTDGTNAFADSQGKVFAKTLKKVTLTLPKKTTMTLPDEDKVYTKSEMIFAGVTIPLTFRGDPLSEHYKVLTDKKLTLLGNDLPIHIRCERIHPYIQKNTEISLKTAERELNNKYMLYKLFLLSDKDTSILKESVEFTQTPNEYVLTSFLTTEENVCENKVVEVRDSGTD